MKIIDLSHDLTPDMPVYPGTPRPIIEKIADVENDGFEERKINVYSHVGTHMDAPAHMIKNGSSLSDFHISDFAGPGCCLDLTKAEDPNIDLSHIEPYEKIISKSEFVILKTGWEKHWGRQEYYSGYPSLNPEAAQWLGGYKIKGLGIDAISADSHSTVDFPVHKTLLSCNTIIVENLANLDSLPESGFVFFCLPIKIKNGDGAPVRAAAMLINPLNGI